MKNVGPLNVLEIASGTGASYAARDLQALGGKVTKVALSGHSIDLPELDLKKRIVLLARTDNEAEVTRLVSEADVLIKACPAADVDGGVFAFSSLRSRYPSLITAAITPFGESGPHRDWQSTDLVGTHAGGLGYITPPRVVDIDNEPPLGIPGDVIEPLSGLVLVLGILNAVLERDRDGRGRHVEVSTEDAVASLMFNNIASYIESGKSAGRRLEDNPSARRPFLPANDGLLVLMANRRHHLRSWLGLLGSGTERLIELLDQGAPLADVSRESSRLSVQWTSQRSRLEATALAQDAHIPMEPVLTPDEVLTCPQLKARGFWEETGSSLRLAGHPYGPLGKNEAPRHLPTRVDLSSPEPWLSFEPGDGPLAGTRVLDFTWVFAGPIASRILAALGAIVVKVEIPGGTNEEPRPFLTRTLHSAKKSAYFDLKDPEARAFVQALASEADVLIENFSTGVMERFELGWDELSRLNPGMTMVSISGMGRTGPYAHHSMFGQLAQAYSGMTSIIGYESGAPRGIEDGGFWSDPVTGYAAAAAVISALRERSITGQGRRIDVSLVEATVSTMFRPLLAAGRGDIWAARGNFHPGMAPHDVYRCAPLDEDRWFALAVRNDNEWAKLCQFLGRADFEGHELGTLEGRQRHHQLIREAVEAWSRHLTSQEAASLCQAMGIPATPSRTTRDVVEDGLLQARGIFVRGVDPSAGPVMMGLPWRLRPETDISYGEAPLPGEQSLVVAKAAKTPSESTSPTEEETV